MLDLRDGLQIGRPRSLFVASVGIVAFVATIYPLTQPELWVGWLPDTVGAAESAAAWAPSVVCVLTAWLSGQPRAHGMGEWVLSSPRSRAERLLPGLALAASILLAATVLSVAVIVGVSTRFGLLDGAERFRTLLLFPGLVGYLALWIPVGAALGVPLRREIALPLAAILPFAVFAALVYSGGSPLAVLAVGDGSVYTYVEPTVSTMAVRAIFWISLALAAWLAVLDRRRLASATLWVTSFAAAAGLFVGATFTPIPGVTAPVCSGSGPTICLEHGFATTMPRYRSAVERIWPLIPTALRTDAVVALPRLAPAAKTALVVPPVAGFTNPARIVDPTMFAARLGNELFVTRCRDGSAGLDTANVLVYWWRTLTAVPVHSSAYAGDIGYAVTDRNSTEQSAAAEAFAALPADTRLAWFDDNASAIRSCTAGDLPG